MEKRHQVFISSTFSDLKEERAEIIQALLELDCIPAGMELFPATDGEAWDLIKGVIDDSDYYCLVLAGRYGSTDAIGISFTEKEYDYAVSQKKPIMAFLHGDIEKLPVSKTEKSEQGRKKLEDFRKKVELAHHRKAWMSAAELGGLVSRSLVNMRKSNPAEGWVRGRFAATEAMQIELANLRAKVAELMAAAVNIASPFVNIEELASGSEKFNLNPQVKREEKGEYKGEHIYVSWDSILRYVGPILVNECTEVELNAKLRLCAFHHVAAPPVGKLSISNVVLRSVTEDRIKIQLQALGYMAAGVKRRTVSDRNTYWRITDRGHQQLIAAQAIRTSKKIETSAAVPVLDATE
ncbi:hypothetical protein JAB5_11010 [Janthinobacterium sp. HH103]|uniref:DUF4062 domain-containing protein n=1 Tax=unclassified Janthinobacterium TaxID=2610881 RepID=UPI0008930327|nr:MULTISPECIES: DUF4062 domain-containing protein [unclassified Janthinobacterium]OEZ54247.1 hypothetical protein JAB2_54050 [Janthinobacterium sp. HH100]OEZ84981.1 hypothetical protein JAB5_11010 [Janthinobacterium sp. HH103]QOU74304.1 hypothetical protein JAB4_037670 [Janthinobacterium sp. HH102]